MYFGLKNTCLLQLLLNNYCYEFQTYIRLVVSWMWIISVRQIKRFRLEFFLSAINSLGRCMTVNDTGVHCIPIINRHDRVLPDWAQQVCWYYLNEIIGRWCCMYRRDSFSFDSLRNNIWKEKNCKLHHTHDRFNFLQNSLTSTIPYFWFLFII